MDQHGDSTRFNHQIWWSLDGSTAGEPKASAGVAGAGIDGGLGETLTRGKGGKDRDKVQRGLEFAYLGTWM